MRVVLVFTYFLFTSLCNRIRHQFRVQNAKFSRSATHEQINEIMSRERIEGNGRLTLATPAVPVGAKKGDDFPYSKSLSMCT